MYLYMKFLLIVLASAIVPIFSMKIFSSKKLCTNCKHFIKPESDKDIGKCSLFPILNDVDDNENKMDTHYLDSISSRKIYYMCGEKGRYFEKVKKVAETPFLSTVDPSFFDQISDFDFEQYFQFV